MLEVMLRRKNQIYIPETNLVKEQALNNLDANILNERYGEAIVTCAININSLGYRFSEDAIKTLLMVCDYSCLIDILTEIESNLRTITGADKEYNPMYPNFPEQVIEAEDYELYVNQFLHYFTYGEWTPEYEKEDRIKLQTKDLVVLDVCKDKDVINLFSNIMSANTSISEQDKKDLRLFFEVFPNAFSYIPESIPFKENMSVVAKIIFESEQKNKIVGLKKMFKTATDVLRFITELSNGDVSLASPCKYKKFSRKDRRMFLSLLNGMKNIEEDMNRHSGKWIRIGEILHPFEYKTSYPKTAEAFNKIRNNIKIETFYSKLQKAYDNKDWTTAISMLKTRSGEFARNLDYIIRNAENKIEVLNEFKSVANNVSTSVILQVKAHFEKRYRSDATRVCFPKGNLSKGWIIEKDLEPLDMGICHMIINICNNALCANYCTRPIMGNVYIAEDFVNYIIPYSQRNASESKKIVTRGSRIKFEGNIIRPFIWWTNMDNAEGLYSNGRVDIDLSVAIIDKDYNVLTHVSYTHTRDKDFEIYHSGDITNGGPVDGKGVAEFIDIDVNKAREQGAKYAIINVLNYTGYKYSEIPHADFGFMVREDAMSGEIFEPSTVENKISLNSASTSCIPVVIDLENNEYIWLDMDGRVGEGFRRNETLENNLKGTLLSVYGVLNAPRVNMYEVIALNSISRGMLTQSKNTADIIFDIDANTEENRAYKEKGIPIITPYDIDVFYEMI